MIYYADTSWWLSLRFRDDNHHLAALALFDEDPQAQVLWTPWQRVEVFNAFCQLERAGRLQQGEAKRIIRRLGTEVRLGYWRHREFVWTDAVRKSVTLAQQIGLTTPIRGMDLFHVAIALSLRVDGFLSFDEDQKTFARAARAKVFDLSTKNRNQPRKRVIRVLAPLSPSVIGEIFQDVMQSEYGESTLLVFIYPHSITAEAMLECALSYKLDLIVLFLNNLKYSSKNYTKRNDSVDFVRRLSTISRVPIFAIWGYPQDDRYRDEILLAGATVAFPAPVAWEEGMKAVRKCLGEA